VAIPDFQSCMRPLLNAVSDGAIHTFNDAFEQVCQFFDLTDAERAEKLPSGKQTVIRNRVAWSRTYMNKAGLLIAPGRSQLQVTDRGLEALKQHPDRVDVTYLKKFPEFVVFHTAKPKAVATDTAGQGEKIVDATDPLERLEDAHQEIQNSLASDLLQTIKDQPPAFLEQLVVELMQAMGYGGWSKESGSATQYTADGGIDGIINDDPLGLETIYLQAKRYSENVVGRPDIQAFVGALEMKRARKGVFITTSKFSAEAKNYISMIEKKVILIDGQQLTELMIRHGLGVSVKETYNVCAVDIDYFSED
jgi:restriction system protein